MYSIWGFNAPGYKETEAIIKGMASRLLCRTMLKIESVLEFMAVAAVARGRGGAFMWKDGDMVVKIK